jgi:hypothetical protein
MNYSYASQEIAEIARQKMARNQAMMREAGLSEEVLSIVMARRL